MEHEDLFDELRAANPYVGEGSTPPTTTSADARFKEITMQPHDSQAHRRNPAAAPSRWRPMIAVPSALAAVAVVIVSALVFSAVTAPSAYALVNEAAQNSAGFDSGRVELQIELREIPDDVGGTLTLDYRYQGDDFLMTQDLSQMQGPDTAELGEFVVIQVGDTIYTQLPGFGTDNDFFAAPVTGQNMWSDSGFGVNPETITPDNIIGLIEKAEDFSEIDSPEDDITTYRGSVGIEIIRQLGASNLPPGLSLLADDSDTDLPETLGITASVKDGQIHQLVVDIIGDTPDGYTDATLTTTFSELGRPQGIVAPSADQIADDAAMENFGMPEGLEDAIAVLDELDQRRPELCNDVFEGIADGTTPPDPGEFEEINQGFIQCLEDEGEPEAAEAFREMTNFGS